MTAMHYDRIGSGMSLLCVPCVPWHTRFSEDPILKIGSMCAYMGSFNNSPFSEFFNQQQNVH